MKLGRFSLFVISALVASCILYPAQGQAPDSDSALSVGVLLEAGLIEAQNIQEALPEGQAAESSQATQPETAKENLSLGGGGGSCYTACYSVAQSELICGPGKIAEVSITGPINNCYLNNLVCKTSCSGPVASCSGFGICY